MWWTGFLINLTFSIKAHWKNVPLAAFLQNYVLFYVAYCMCCRNCNTFQIKCPAIDTKSVQIYAKKLMQICHWFITLVVVRHILSMMSCAKRLMLYCINLTLKITYHLNQGCQTQFLEGHSPTEFISNPAPTHIPCSFQLSLKDLISCVRCV